MDRRDFLTATGVAATGLSLLAATSEAVAQVAGAPAPLSALDYIEIQQLIARYGFTIDFRDLDGFAALFTPDGIWESRNTRGDISYPGGKINHRQGPEQLKAFAMEQTSKGHGRHHITNTLIEGDANFARAMSYYFGSTDLGMPETERGTPQVRYGITGIYKDELKKLNGRWLFSKRTFRYDGYPEILDMYEKPIDLKRPFLELPGAR